MGGISKGHVETFESNIHICILMVIMVLQVYICPNLLYCRTSTGMTSAR